MLEILGTIAVELWRTLCEMAPYLLFGFAVAGVLSVLIRPETVERQLGGTGIWPVIKATLFGIPLPLCSCGVIPVAASLRRHGSSRGATTAFLLSTPQTGVDSILVTFSLLGPVFAVFRPVAALVTGVIGGGLVDLFSGDRQAGSKPAEPCDAPCCAGTTGRGKLIQAIRYGFVTLPKDIAKPLLIGVAAAGVIAAIVPDDYFAGILGGGILAMLVMMLLGLPVYVCATASVPVAAALIAKGVSPGAALVFLVTGPATNAATIATIWKIAGRRTAAIYLATVAATALASGALLDYIFAVHGQAAAPEAPWMLPSWLSATAAFVLLALLAIAMLHSHRVHAHDEPGQHEEPTPHAGSVERTQLAISGMTCQGCVATVRQALIECAGVESADVDLRTGRATVTGKNLEPGALCQAVEQVGYKAAPSHASGHDQRTTNRDRPAPPPPAPS